MRKRIKKNILLLTIVLSLIVLSPFLYIFLRFHFNNYSEFQKFKIEDSETGIYFRDGKNKLGNIFNEEHRVYIPLKNIPSVLKNGVLAMEDKKFYNHNGVDFERLVYSLFKSFFSKNSQGGSTITQQVVKNLKHIQRNNIFTKINEIVDAPKLEKIYSKDKILEIYLNMFAVPDNGRGIYAASQFYFNKDISDLNTNEISFIISTLQSPGRMNPFSARSSNDFEKRNAFINNKKNVVLSVLFRNNLINADEYKINTSKNIEFNHGEIKFNNVSIYKKIIDEINGNKSILNKLGIVDARELDTKGYRIVTTFDEKTQKNMVYEFRNLLSSTEISLNGMSFAKNKKTNYGNINLKENNGFYIGKIEHVNKSPGQESILVDLGGWKCTVNQYGIDKIASLNNNYLSLFYEDKISLLKEIESNHYIHVRINSKNKSICYIEAIPTVSGGSIILNKGEVFAMVGGFESNEFNRALYAYRQPASTFKAPVFYAALQLGWKPTDKLSNVPDFLALKNKIYFQPYHSNKQNLESTMLIAADHSQNISSLWLLKHLLDKLDEKKFNELMLNFLPKDKPYREQYLVQKIQNRYGISATDENQIKSGVLDFIKNDFIKNKKFLPEEESFLRTLHMNKELLNLDFQNEQDSMKLFLEQNIVKNNLKRWIDLAKNARNNFREVKKILNKNVISSDDVKTLGLFRVSKSGDKLFFNSNDEWFPFSEKNQIQDSKPLSEMNILENKNILNKLSVKNIYLDDFISINLVEDIYNQFTVKYKKVEKLSQLKKLFYHADLRYLIAIDYVAKMIESIVDGVKIYQSQALPLGGNYLSVSQMALIYQTLANGKQYEFPSQKNKQLSFIKYISDRNGTVLWESIRKEKQLIDPKFSKDILTVLHQATLPGGSLSLTSKEVAPDVPIYAKTGTSFGADNITFVSLFENKKFPDLENMFVISAYIGFDKSKPLVEKRNNELLGGVYLSRFSFEIINNMNNSKDVN